PGLRAGRARGARRADGPRRLLDAARRGGPWLRVPPRRPPRHAHARRGRERRRRRERLPGGGAGGDHLPLRRGPLQPAHRAAHRRGPRVGADPDHAAARRGRGQRLPAGAPPRAPGPAHVPGAAHPRERRARRAPRGPRGRLAAARARRQARGALLPLARGPHRQALPPRQPALRGPDEEAPHRLPRGGRREPARAGREAAGGPEGGDVTDYAYQGRAPRPWDERPAAAPVAAEARAAGGAVRLALPLYLVPLLAPAAVAAAHQALPERPGAGPVAAAARAAGGAFRLALPLYLVLLLALAALGVANQPLLERQVALTRQKESLLASVARAEVRAAAVEGPLAVARWATE